MKAKNLELTPDQQNVLEKVLEHQIALTSDRIKNLDSAFRNATNSCLKFDSEQNQKDIDHRNNLKAKLDHMKSILNNLK